MIHALIDPNIFLLSETDWNIDDKRESFLELINCHLKIINELDIIKIVWCDEFDERIWSYPQLHPWKSNAIYNQSMTQILYYTLTKHKIVLSISDNEILESNPPLNSCCSESLNYFLQLVDAAKSYDNLFFCPGNVNIREEEIFFKKCNIGDWFTYPTIKECKTWYNKIDITSHFWPRSREDEENFKKCINFTALSLDFRLSNLKKYDFCNSFMRKILHASQKEKLIKMLVKRLQMTLQEASMDAQLQDESLSDGIRRFRVTQRPTSLRVHYRIIDDSISFIDFFDVGEHDDGL